MIAIIPTVHVEETPTVNVEERKEKKEKSVQITEQAKDRR